MASSMGKFAPPPTPIAREDEEKVRKATAGWVQKKLLKNLVNQYRGLNDAPSDIQLPLKNLTGVIASTGQPQAPDADDILAFKNALALELVQTMNKNMPDEINESFVVEFNNWILGKSALNDPTYTPWGYNKLVGKEFDVYVSQYVLSKMKFKTEITALYVKGPPQNLRDAWIWFKYIICQKPPPDQDYLHEFNWWTDLEFQQPSVQPNAQTSQYATDFDPVTRIPYSQRANISDTFLNGQPDPPPNYTQVTNPATGVWGTGARVAQAPGGSVGSNVILPNDENDPVARNARWNAGQCDAVDATGLMPAGIVSQTIANQGAILNSIQQNQVVAPPPPTGPNLTAAFQHAWGAQQALTPIIGNMSSSFPSILPINTPVGSATAAVNQRAPIAQGILQAVNHPQIQQLNQKITNQQAQLQQAQQQLAQTQSQATQQINQGNQTLQQAQDTITSQQLQIAQQNAQLNQLNSQLQQAQTQSTVNNQNINQGNQQVASLTQQVNDTNTRAQREIAQRQQEITNLHNQLLQEKNNHSAKIQENNKLHRDIVDLKNRMQSIDLDYGRANKELTENLAKSDTVKKNLENVNIQLVQRLKQMESIQQDTWNKSQQYIQERDDKIIELQANETRLKDEIETHKAQFQELYKTLNTLKAEMSMKHNTAPSEEHMQHLKRVETQLAQALNTNAEYTRHMQMLQVEKNLLEGKVKSFATVQGENFELYKSKEKEVEDKAKLIEQLKQMKFTAEAELQTTTKKLEETSEIFNAKYTEYTQQQAQYYQQELDKIRIKSQQTAQEKANIEAELNRTMQAYAKVKDEKIDAEKANEQYGLLHRKANEAKIKQDILHQDQMTIAHANLEEEKRKYQEALVALKRAESRSEGVATTSVQNARIRVEQAQLEVTKTEEKVSELSSLTTETEVESETPERKEGREYILINHPSEAVDAERLAITHREKNEAQKKRVRERVIERRRAFGREVEEELRRIHEERGLEIQFPSYASALGQNLQDVFAPALRPGGGEALDPDYAGGIAAFKQLQMIANGVKREDLNNPTLLAKYLKDESSVPAEYKPALKKMNELVAQASRSQELLNAQTRRILEAYGPHTEEYAEFVKGNEALRQDAINQLKPEEQALVGGTIGAASIVSTLIANVPEKAGKNQAESMVDFLKEYKQKEQQINKNLEAIDKRTQERQAKYQKFIQQNEDALKTLVTNMGSDAQKIELASAQLEVAEREEETVKYIDEIVKKLEANAKNIGLSMDMVVEMMFSTIAEITDEHRLLQNKTPSRISTEQRGQQARSAFRLLTGQPARNAYSKLHQAHRGQAISVGVY